MHAFRPLETPVALRPMAGEVASGSVVLCTTDSLEIGVWEHTIGTSTDVEIDEAFIVVAGRATVTTDDGTTIELAPGTVGAFEAGARTTWVVHETLRKVYVLAQ